MQSYALCCSMFELLARTLFWNNMICSTRKAKVLETPTMLDNVFSSCSNLGIEIKKQWFTEVIFVDTRN